MNSVQKLYKTIYDIAIQVQISGINGKDIWKKIESMIENIKLEPLYYNDTLKVIYSNMNNIPNYEDIQNNESNPISNHFFLQLRNLVETKSAFIIYLNRIGQLAYNAGQLSVFIDKNNLNQDIKKFVLENNMLDINTYISIENQNIIDMILNQNNIDKIIEIIKNILSQQGGNNNYLQKYLKYKQKYINLKNIFNFGDMLAF